MTFALYHEHSQPGRPVPVLTHESLGGLIQLAAARLADGQLDPDGIAIACLDPIDDQVTSMVVA